MGSSSAGRRVSRYRMNPDPKPHAKPGVGIVREPRRKSGRRQAISSATLHSSLLNDLKVPVKIAQEQLGQASISTTLNICTHVVDASHRKAVEKVEERLFCEIDRRDGLLWTEVGGCARKDDARK